MQLKDSPESVDVQTARRLKIETRTRAGARGRARQLVKIGRYNSCYVPMNATSCFKVTLAKVSYAYINRIGSFKDNTLSRIA